MNDRELVARLNALLTSPEVSDAFQKVMEHRVEIDDVVLNHPTIQCSAQTRTVGMLGLLNGIVGVLPDEYGHIAAVYSEDKLERFELVQLRR
jgi:hypothetical protein